MIAEGQIVLFRFPHTDQHSGRLRPALIIRKLPGQYDDWLICMISSQLNQEIPAFDEIITPDDPDFADSGLKVASLIRIGRLAVINTDILVGQIGRLADTRLATIKQKLSQWIQST